MSYLEELNERLEKTPVDSELACIKTVSINVTDVCNRTCSYCPHGHGFYGDPYTNMVPNLFPKIRERLDELPVKPRITISGMGEPMLYPYLRELIKTLKGYKIDILTNGSYPVIGDTSDFSSDFNDNVTIIVSVHDKREESELISRWKGHLGFSMNIKIRHHDPSSPDCELIQTNRAGWKYCNITDHEIVYKGFCSCMFYKLMIDSDGSYLLCADDWARKSKSYDKNVRTMPIKDYLLSIRPLKNLMLDKGRQAIKFCQRCNINGTLLGESEVKWYAEHIHKPVAKTDQVSCK